MAEPPGKAIGPEGFFELQRDHTKNSDKSQADKKDVITTVRSVVEDRKKGDADTSGWDESDKEILDPKDPLSTFSHLRTGMTAPDSLTSFVKLKEFERFYCWVDVKHSEVKKWFDKNRLYARHWDLFYVYAPTNIEARVIILVPLPQAEHFLRTINRHLNTNLKMPSDTDRANLILEFADNGTPRPRFIASSTMPEDIRLATAVCPHRSYIPEIERTNHDDYKTPTDEGFMYFRAKMATLSEDDRLRKENDAFKKMERRHHQQKAKGHEILRAQRYLGLRKKNESAAGGKIIEVEKEEADAESESECEDELNVGQPTPHPQESSVVFVCIDIEAFEFRPNQITEIGIATLDMNDIDGVAPGKTGCHWWKMIRAQHFIVKEFRHLENKVHCRGNRDGFVFGQSELVWSRNVKDKILSCFKPPFSKPGNPYSNSFLHPERNIVFIGHDAKQDIQYLKRLNVDLSQIKNIIDVLDSSNMCQSLRRELNGSSLEKTLLHLGLVGCNLHNGGNDAVYTMRALIGIAIKAKVDRKELEAEHERELERRIEAEKDHASKVIRMQKEGWKLDSDDDGGEPRNPFARFGSKASTPQAPKPKIIVPAKGSCTCDLDDGVACTKDWNAFPPLPARPTRPQQ